MIKCDKCGDTRPGSILDIDGDIWHRECKGVGACGMWRNVPTTGPKSDAVNHPAHYTAHPSGVECIAIVEHMNFCCGGAVKYIWRAGLKGDAIEDLKKAAWLIDREIKRRESMSKAKTLLDTGVEDDG